MTESTLLRLPVEVLGRVLPFCAAHTIWTLRQVSSTVRSRTTDAACDRYIVVVATAAPAGDVTSVFKYFYGENRLLFVGTVPTLPTAMPAGKATVSAPRPKAEFTPVMTALLEVICTTPHWCFTAIEGQDTDQEARWETAQDAVQKPLELLGDCSRSAFQSESYPLAERHYTALHDDFFKQEFKRIVAAEFVSSVVFCQCGISAPLNTAFSTHVDDCVTNVTVPFFIEAAPPDHDLHRPLPVLDDALPEPSRARFLVGSLDISPTKKEINAIAPTILRSLLHTVAQVRKEGKFDIREAVGLVGVERELLVEDPVPSFRLRNPKLTAYYDRCRDASHSGLDNVVPASSLVRTVDDVTSWDEPQWVTELAALRDGDGPSVLAVPGGATLNVFNPFEGDDDALLTVGFDPVGGTAVKCSKADLIDSWIMRGSDGGLYVADQEFFSIRYWPEHYFPVEWMKPGKPFFNQFFKNSKSEVPVKRCDVKTTSAQAPGLASNNVEGDDIPLDSPWMLWGPTGCYSSEHLEPHRSFVFLHLFGGSKRWFFEAPDGSWGTYCQEEGTTLILPPTVLHVVVNAGVMPTYAIARNFLLEGSV